MTNIKDFTLALAVVLAATVISANAQKTYTEGVVTSTTSMRGNAVEGKKYFRSDSVNS